MNTVIIPCYFKDESFLHMTDKCLKSLGRQDHIIVVDDGSPLKMVVPKYCDKVIRHENGGYAAAVNSGLKKATGSYLIISNNDIEFIQHDWLEHLLKPLKMGYGISSIRTTDADGWDTEDRIEENAKFGSLWAMTREVFNELGYMDERFGKGLFEDLDYWRRARDLGIKIAKNHNGLVEHKGKATFKEVDPTNEMFMKNMFVYKEKWGDKAHIIEVKPNAILLVDDYELAEMSQAKDVLKLEVSLDEAVRRWGKQW